MEDQGHGVIMCTVSLVIPQENCKSQMFEEGKFGNAFTSYLPLWKSV